MLVIDAKGNDYPPHLFGNDGAIVIRQPAELPGHCRFMHN